MEQHRKYVVVITGASRGIGEATAYCFARGGHTVIVTYNNSSSHATIVRDRCLQLGAANAQAFPLNIRSTASRTRFVEQLTHSVDEVDVLINNAGVLVRKPLALLTEVDIDDQIETNLSGPIKLVCALLPHGLKRVINVASDLSKYGLPNFSVYCATKFGLRGFTQAFALETAVDVLCVNPDKTGTAMNDGQGRTPDVPAKIIFNAAIGKYLVTSGGDVDVRELVEENEH